MAAAVPVEAHDLRRSGPDGWFGMIEEISSAADDWKRADEAQKEAEALLKEAWHSYFSKDGRAPSAELIAEVSRLRRIADEKLQEAIECAGARAADRN